MPIRPTDVRRKEFRNGFRGYDANQVDDFLDAVADEFERTYAENSRLREEVSSLRERLQQFEELEGSIRAALVHAEQAANDLRRTATWEAEDIRKSASREADLTIREAQARAHQMLAESSARVERIQTSYDALQEAKRSFTNDFRQLLKTYADVMDNMEISSARKIEASLRERLDTESMTVAREAAAHEPEDAGQTGPEPSEGVVAGAASAEDDAATRRIEPETAGGPTPEEIGSEIAELETTEPEFEPSSASEAPVVPTETRDPDVPSEGEPAAAEPAAADEPSAEEPATVDESARPEEPAAPAGEVEREEPTLAEESSSQGFFDREEGGETSQEGGGDSRIFRASRFLRRRE
jgi:cell division initiation protein